MTIATRNHTAQEIYNDITAYMKQNGYNASFWYAGITQDIDQRLFGYHNVSKQYDSWVWCPAINIIHARSAEKALLDFGCDGGDGGGDNDAVCVYCYLKTSGTKR